MLRVEAIPFEPLVESWFNIGPNIKLSETLANPMATPYGAWISGTPVAFGILMRQENSSVGMSNWNCLTHFCVRPEYRKSGVGTWFLNEIVNQSGLKSGEQVIAGSRMDVTGFWVKNGFKAKDSHFDSHGVVSLRMNKVVA